MIVPPAMTQQANAMTSLDMMTFDSSKGYMRINADQPLIPTETLNTQNLYNLLVKLQQNNKLELNNDSLTSQFYISSQELSSLLEPNQIANVDVVPPIDSQNVNIAAMEPNNNNVDIVNQNVFATNEVLDQNPIYYMATNEQTSFVNFNTTNQNSLNQPEMIMSNQNTGASVCQELCCLLKFNALVDNGNQIF